MTRTTSRREFAARLLRRSGAAPGAQSHVPLPDEWHLLLRATFGPTPQDLVEVNALGYEGWLDAQLQDRGLDDSASDAAVAALTGTQNRRATTEFLTRMLTSRNQLRWRMAYFLHNHFNTDLRNSNGLAELEETRAFAALAFGPFSAVLERSAKSPAMIRYLNSDENVAGAPNENYAREVLELHTLGAGNDYTEADIVEVAKIFTGWSAIEVRPPGQPDALSDTFVFRPLRHEPGPKNVSGLKFSTPGYSGAAGVREGEDFLRHVAGLPGTADFLARKMAVFFAADDPSPALVAAVAARYRATGGMLGECLRTLFLHPEFRQGPRREKTLSGLEFLTHLIRRSGASFPVLRAGQELQALGESLHVNPVPTGYPEVGSAWQGAGNLLPRWNLAYRLLQGQIPGAQIPLADFFGQPFPQNEQEWVERALTRLVDLDVPPATKDALTLWLQGRFSTLPPGAPAAARVPHLRDLIQLVIGLPESFLN